MKSFKIFEMEIKIDQHNNVVFFEEDYPACMDIPEIMRTEHPSCTTRILPYEKFNELDLPVVGRRVLGEER